MQGTFAVLDASVPRERQAWLDAWQSWPGREVFAHPDYAALFAGAGDRCLCAWYSSPDGGGVLYPFIYRDVSGLAVARGFESPVADITTPYGYGGPFAWSLTSPDATSSQFWASFDAWAGLNGVVAEFVRFDLRPESLLPYPGAAVVRSRNIVRSLELDDDAMWMSFEQKVRKNVKKAQRSEVSVTVDQQGEFLSDFMRLYSGTMDRREADASYYFPQSFFESIHRDLVGQFAYFHACREDEIVSTELVLISERSVYSFLGGTDSSAFEFRPNDLLKYEIIRWSRAQGKSAFVLGGGATPDDGIERYKRAFAPDGAIDFITGQRILTPNTYDEMVRASRSEFESSGRPWPEDASFFPAYRMPL